MAMISAQHHSAQRCCSIATQTDDFVPAATYAATASLAATYAAAAAPSPMVEYVDPAPVVTYAAPAPVIEYVSSAPVTDYGAPAPAMTYVASSQQLPPAYTMTTDITDDNFDITDWSTRNFPVLLRRLLHHRSLFHFLPMKSFSAPVYTVVAKIITCSVFPLGN